MYKQEVRNWLTFSACHYHQHILQIFQILIGKETLFTTSSNMLQEDVQLLTKSELGSNIKSEAYDHHGWDPM